MPKNRNGKKILFFERLFAFLFHILYNQLSWIYDQIAWIVSAGLWKEWVFSVLPNLGENKILELGFGPGHLQKEGARLSKKMYGVDISPSMVKICQKKLKDANHILNISLANAMYLPFADSIFDQVVATFPSPYIFELQTLSEIDRVLVPNGQLLIIPTAWTTSKKPIHRFFSWLFNLGNRGIETQKYFMDYFIKPLQKSGFETNHKEIFIENSQVLLIEAKKR